jgi:hypothetical protein
MTDAERVQKRERYEPCRRPERRLEVELPQSYDHQNLNLREGWGRAARSFE